MSSTVPTRLPLGRLFGALLAAAALAAALLASPAAAEPPPAPALLETSPGSPGLSDAPRVIGDSDGVVASVVPSAGSASAALAATSPSNTITLYTDASCAGPVVGVGSAAQLEGAGIEVTSPVAHDAITTFYANQSDGVETSECSDGLSYRQVSTAPGRPVFTAVVPASPADENNPRLIGNAEAESLVSIYTDASCAGPAVAAGSGLAFSGAGIEVSVPDNSTTTFYAVASWAGLESPCSESSITYQEHTVLPPPVEEQPPPPTENPPAPPGKGALPAPRLRVLPAARANDNSPRVTGVAPGAAVVRVYGNPDCDGSPLVKGAVGQLAGGFAIQVADDTTSRFYGVAVDEAGEPSSCSSSAAVYVEDSTPPATRITLGPGVKTRARSPVFRFTDATEEPGTSFFCKLDKWGWRPCQTPWRVPRVGRKAHLVRVKAVDAAGNAEAIGAQRRFKVVSRPRR